MRFPKVLGAGLALLAMAATAWAEDEVTRRVLTLEAAKAVAGAAAAEARRLNAPGGAIAIVDDGGHPLYLERLDGTFAAGATISIGKARTAVLFKKPTRVFEELINKGRTAMTTVPAVADFTPLIGGIPIVVDGEIVGGIGVSGAASAQQDEEIALAGAKAMITHLSGTTPPGAVTYFDAARVAAAFAKGEPLLEVEGYKVHASRRTEPGVVEVHTWETDVVYVLGGSATLVTGGTVVEPMTTEPGQIRGRVIEGGESRRIARGDVIVIPQGQPHWFKEVDGPLLYFVVKPIVPHGETHARSGAVR